MLQKVSTPLDAIADLPTCRKLAQARAALEEARQAEQVATAALRVEYRRTADRGSILLDPPAQKVEAEAVRASAAMRLAASEAEKLKQAHGLVIQRHFAKHETAVLDMLIEPLRDAREAARKIVKALEAGERDGGTPSHRLGKAKRTPRQLNEALAQLQ